MAEGWIKLSRQIQDSWLWKRTDTFDIRSAWIDLLMLANYEDKKVPYRGKIITCKRGDVNLSFTELGRRWNWNRKKVSRYIELLESDGMVTTNVTTNRTTITIVNYGKFQDSCPTDWATDSPTNVQRMSITNKEKKEKNIKKFIPQNKFNDFQKTEYDFEELERLLNEN